MIRRPYLYFIFIIFLVSCKEKATIAPLKVANDFYKALSNNDQELMNEILGDSITIVEMDYDYKESFSKSDYLNKWMQWDAVFQPDYTVHELTAHEETVQAHVSKIDPRIQLMHEGPTSWYATLYIEDGHIDRIERSNETFNDSLWVANRTIFLEWMKAHHPDYPAFIFDQSIEGGQRFLAAVGLYQAREQ